MDRINHTIALDLQRGIQAQTIRVMEDDTKSRAVKFVISSGGLPFEISNFSAGEVHFRRADGTSDVYTQTSAGEAAVSVSKNVVTALIDKDITQTAGRCRMSVVLKDTSGRQIATFPILVDVIALPTWGGSGTLPAEKKKYSISRSLTNCTISNTATEIEEGEPYKAVITPDAGTELTALYCTMGNTRMPVDGMSVNITKVVGNITIVASAAGNGAFVSMNQGVENAGKVLGIGTDGRVSPVNAEKYDDSGIQSDINAIKQELEQAESRLSESITEISDILLEPCEYTETSGYFTDIGNISSPSASQEVYTEKIYIGNLSYIHFKFKCRISTNLWLGYMLYDESQTVVGKRHAMDVTGDEIALDIKTDKNIKYIAFSYRTYGTVKGATIAKYVNSESIIKGFETTTDDILLSELDVSTLDVKYYSYIRFDTGTSNGSGTYFRWYALPVVGGQRIRARLYSLDTVPASIAFYESENVDSTKYIKSASVRARDVYNRGEWYDAVTPQNAKLAVFTTRIDAENLDVKILTERFATSKYEYNDSTLINSLEDHAGYLNSEGNIASQSEKKEVYTDKIYNCANTTYELKYRYSVPRESWLAIGYYHENGAFTRENLDYGVSAFVKCKVVVPKGIKAICFMYRSYDDAHLEIKNLTLANSVAIHNESDITNSNLAVNPLRYGGCYDHLFVNRRQYSNVPHESVHHVRLSKRMGFDVIEANVNKTKDGVYVVNHLDNGALSGWFHHVDNVTDVSNVKVSDVTWEWLCDNVRYNSSISKYQTKLCRLEEFLSECKQQGVIPFVSCIDADVVRIANAYMGENNYIAYSASRKLAPTAIIYHWCNHTNKNDIINYCEKIGKPFIYGMANPQNYSLEELKDIVDTLHNKGYWIGTSYADSEWHKYVSIGFDFNGTQTRINRITNGNICNFDSVIDYNDFDVINGTNVDGMLQFNTDGMITPKINNASYSVCGIDVQLDFVGTIEIPPVGEHQSRASYSSDGQYPFFAAIPIIDGSPKINITIKAGTVIKDISFKASRF